LAVPGEYRVELTVSGTTYTQSFRIVKDPRVQASDADLAEQHALCIAIRDKLTQTHAAATRIRSIREQLEQWVRRAEGHAQEAAVREKAKAVQEQLSALEDELVPKQAGRGLDRSPRLNNKLAHLFSVVESADAPPTRQARELFAELCAFADERFAKLETLIATEVAAFETLVREAGLPVIATGAGK
jgi:chromosome segregation ATPase